MSTTRLWALFGIGLFACGGSDGSAGSTTTSSSSSSSSSGTSTTSSALSCESATTATSTVAPSGCAVLDRDTSACKDSRTALGLSGVWLEFSCRVTLGVSSGNVTATIDGQPDYKSNYFPAASACYEAYTGAITNPNVISTLAATLTLPLTGTSSGGKMQGAIVGVALNGVPIFGDFAAPGDDIFQEAQTFDECGGHPQGDGVYHYHGEPYSLTYDDARLVGVLLDGYPVYGRKDADGSTPTLDAAGGHTGTTAESPSTAVYHYHVNEQTSTGARTGGEKQWFLTTGTYHGAAGSCSGTGC